MWQAGTILSSALVDIVDSRRGVKDPTFEAKTNDLTKICGQGPTFLGQTLSRPRAGMVEAKAKDQRHNFSKLWLANFSCLLNARVFKILHFEKFLMIIFENSKNNNKSLKLVLRNCSFKKKEPKLS